MPTRYLLFFIATIVLSCGTNSSSTDFIKELTIKSKEKGKTYQIWIHLPEDYDLNSGNYNTIYLLDAISDREFVSETSKKVSKQHHKKNVVIIGIGHGDNREVDYTPTITNLAQGNSIAFMNFIKKELIPAIEEKFRVDTTRESRGILGHSYGGLFGAWSFVKHNQIFGNYILLSPSLFYDNRIFFEFEKKQRDSIVNQKQLIYLGIGGKEKGMLPEIVLFNEILKKYYKETTKSFEIIKGKGHNSSKDENIKKGLLFYFMNR